jgi:hypothetical protein
MNILITIRYNSPAGPVLQSGYFPIKGKKPEQIAYGWWKRIQLEVYTEGLISVVIGIDEDITEKVQEIEKGPAD